MIETRPFPDGVVLDVPAMFESEALQLAVQEQLESGQRRIILNLAQVTFIESSGLGSLVSAFKYCESHGGALGFCGIQPQVRQLLDLTKLSRVLKLFADEQDALAALSA
ncbi:MAG: STAS domain-containing protein [Vampirovibrionales bacterium]|nr:STAS domain-containing protein [Vampirovibrionales bacterium]